MNETETHYEVKSELGARYFLETTHKQMGLPAWAAVGIALHAGGIISWSVYGAMTKPYRFITGHGSTIDEACAAFRTELSGDKIRAEIEKLQAQLAQVEGGAAA